MKRSPSRRAVYTGLWAAACAVVALALHVHVSRRLHGDLEPAMSRALGEEVSIGAIDASLTGALRLSDVSLGDAVSADWIEAGYTPGDLMDGRVSPREISVVRPRVHLEVDATGASNLDRALERLRARLAARRPTGGGTTGTRRLRRVVIAGGDLDVEVRGVGRLRVAGVELFPTDRGVRVVSGRVDVAWERGRVRGVASFARAAADLDLPALEVSRLLAIDGAGRVAGVDVTGLALSSGGRRSPVRLAGRVVAPGGELDPGDIDVEIDLIGRRVALTLERAPLAGLAAVAPHWVDLGAARATGSLVLTRAAGAPVFDLLVQLDGARVASRYLADQPVVLDGEVEARGSVDRAGGRTFLAMDHARLERGGVALVGSGRIEWARGRPFPVRAAIQVEVPRSGCAEALAAIPDQMRSALGGFEVAGDLGAAVAIGYDFSDPEATELDLDIDVDGCQVIVEPALADPELLRKPFDHRLPDGRVVHIGTGDDYARLAVLPRHVIGAFVAAEDARFFRHRGFDPEQIEKSFAIDVAEERVLRGGSTITQQLVKNVFLGPERTAARKLQEAILTWRLEARADKQLILERYLNIIELGERDVFGVGVAARHWFGVPASRLGVRQAAFLAALTPAPRTLSRRLRAAGAPDQELLARIDVVLRAMRQAGFIDAPALERARREPMHLAPTSLARSAAPLTR